MDTEKEELELEVDSTLEEDVDAEELQTQGVLIENGRKELGGINGFIVRGENTIIYYGENKEVEISSEIISGVNLSNGDELVLVVKDGEYTDIIKQEKADSDITLWLLLAFFFVIIVNITRR